MEKDENQSRWATAGSLLLIALVTIVTYGFMIPKLGFYRDDWYMIWSAQAQGAQGVINLFKIDRPFIGILYALDYSLLGNSAINWHVYALVVKLLGGFALYWLLRMLWPERRLEATFAALLYTVYPGFYQQPNAALFINLLLSHTAAILSLALSVYALKVKNLPTQVAIVLTAVLLALFYLIIYEAMIGLEAARLLILWYVTYQQNPPQKWRANLWPTLKRAIPYLVLAIGFVYWRLFFFQSTRRSTNVSVLLDEYSSAPVHGIVSVLIEIAKDFFDITIFAWSVPLYQSVTNSEYRDLGASLLLASLAIGLVVAFYAWTKQKKWFDEREQGNDSSRHMVILGILVVLVTSIPIVVAGRNASFSFQWDRYTVQSILGVTICIVGFAFGYIRPPARWIFLSALVASGVITQFHSAAYYREFWNQERNIWWQLTWRAPGLQPGTTLIASPPPGYRFLEEYEVWGPLNIIYSPGEPLKFSGQVPFDGIEYDLADGKKNKRTMRSITVNRDYSKPLIVSTPTLNSCLHVINGQRTELTPEDDSRIKAIAPYSNINLIVTDADPVTPPSGTFGKEPKHDWCYYYQKIDLARQTEDWAAAAKLADEASDLGLLAADRSEWLPVIEAYVNVGELEKADVFAQRIKSNQEVHATICDQLVQYSTWPASTDSATFVGLVCNKN